MVKVSLMAEAVVTCDRCGATVSRQQISIMETMGDGGLTFADLGQAMGAAHAIARARQFPAYCEGCAKSL